MKNKISKKIIAILTIFLFFNYTLVLSTTTKMYFRNASVTGERRVNPIGRTIGLKLYTDGVLVVGMSEFEGIDGQMHEPYKNS